MEWCARGLQSSLLMPAGAVAVEQLAGEAAERALELRQLTEKGARLRKKKALIDLLKALADLGFTKRRSAVPAHDRTVQAWFSQVINLTVLHSALPMHGRTVQAQSSQVTTCISVRDECVHFTGCAHQPCTLEDLCESTSLHHCTFPKQHCSLCYTVTVSLQSSASLSHLCDH